MKMKIDTKQLDSLVSDMLELKASLIDRGYKHFVSITPIKSGNARKNTSKTKDTIEANYPYAQRLDTGWSKQAPDGMTKPTEQFLENEIQNILKGK